jgi:hypothetical protein
MADLRYPIGAFQAISAPSAADRRDHILQLAEIPGKLRLAVESLSASQLDTPYRPEGWTVRQVVHHLADSGFNWYIRTRLALTEDKPAIKPYDEKLWAELSDARVGPIEPSLLMLDGLHARWASLFESLEPGDWGRELFHPERGVINLDFVLQVSTWHGRHHTTHITEFRSRMMW